MLIRHRHLRAWLGVFAMWLVIMAPWVLPWHRAHAATSEGMVCRTVHASRQGEGVRRTGDYRWHLDACRDCGFFTHAPAISAPGAPSPAWAPLVFFRATAPAVGQARAERYPCACRSRAPPERT